MPRVEGIDIDVGLSDESTYIVMARGGAETRSVRSWFV